MPNTFIPKIGRPSHEAPAQDVDRSGDESGDRSDDFYSFTERGRTARECRRRVTCYGRHLKDVAWHRCHREPSRVGSCSPTRPGAVCGGRVE
ncbi:hypothetical protein EVAR_61390_1 [Eumeta japonica]|uniref:Uncharacterized protein n=1 Tax=Eumeta variegata TaxID=151549 RepID=A0A4C1ZC60_EUMVA|nr:hypothetical protein EVAR_61390_1 [Eumeta japonica]